MRTTIRLRWALCAALGAGTAAASAQVAEAPLVPARAQTQAATSGKVEMATALPGGRGGIVGATALGGLEVYSADGRRLSTTPAGEAAAVAVAAPADRNGNDGAIVASIDATGNFLRLFRARGTALEEAGARPLSLGFAAEGVCLYRHSLDGNLYAFIVGDAGEIDQQLIYAHADGKLDARPVRRIQVPSTVKQCAADAHGHVYAMQETTGLWRFNADPEADLAARIVDAPRLGHLGKKAKGVAVYDGGAGNRWLFASDTAAGHINIYDRDANDAWLGAFRAGTADAAIAEPGPLSTTNTALLPAAKRGALLLADEDTGDFRLLAIDDIATALKLAPPATEAAARPTRPVATVSARIETTPVESYGDAADDPAIWAHPEDPARSLVVATDKKAGLYLYDMQGKVLQFLPDGKMNNIDLRDGFELGGRKVVLVSASNRTDKSISLYRLDTERRELVGVADGVQPTGLGDPYGLCMYRSARDGGTYVFINGDDTRMRQWRLIATPAGKVRAEPVRDLTFDSQTEGCVADDATGQLYVNEEDVAMWKLSAEPDGGNDRTASARVKDLPAVKDDLEGLGIYDLGNGRGYIVVSSQGNDTYAVFRREGSQEYLGSFAVVADPQRGIDGISETDGLEITSRNLGPGFEHGAMIAQDGRNVMPVENQNYKYVSWSDIAKALKLEIR